MMPPRTWWRVALAGGLGGLVNATLVFTRWPVEVVDYEWASFKWHIVPAGFMHGSLLALVAALAAGRARRLPPVLRIPWFILVGWVGGYLSAIPLRMSLNEKLAIAMFFDWPHPWWEPLRLFGGVTALLISWIAWRRRDAPFWLNATASCVAGTLGSLWFWLDNGWYLSPLHGCIWGYLVGLAISRREPGTTVSTARVPTDASQAR